MRLFLVEDAEASVPMSWTLLSVAAGQRFLTLSVEKSIRCLLLNDLTLLFRSVLTSSSTFVNSSCLAPHLSPKREMKTLLMERGLHYEEGVKLQ